MRRKDNNATKGKLLKMGDAANLLHVSAQTLRDWTDADKIKAIISEGGHRTYYEADVKKLALAEKGITTFWTVTCVVAIPANGDKYYYLDPETYEKSVKPKTYEVEFDEFWNAINGLQEQPHAVALSDKPVVLTQGSARGTHTVQVKEAGNSPLLAHHVIVAGLSLEETKALMPSAISNMFKYLEDNYRAEQTVVWMDAKGREVSL